MTPSPIASDAAQRPPRLLFLKNELAWPRRRGYDVHTFFLMKALAAQGYAVALATRTPVDSRAIDGLTLSGYYDLNGVGAAGKLPVRMTRVQTRVAAYWGVAPDHVAAARAVIDVARPDVVIAVGLGTLPLLAAAEGSRTVWYAGDEEAYRHLSQFRWSRPATWHELRSAAIVAASERAFRRSAERVWVVSAGEQRRMRRVIGRAPVDVVVNGIDAGVFRAVDCCEIECSCAFWGRLDFEPNVQALEWFLGNIWPHVRRAEGKAQLFVYGANPSARAEALATAPGVSLIADAPDLCRPLSQHPVAVLPFVSGGGIKNKLLEAASLGRAIVATPKACEGLRGGRIPVERAASAAEWVAALCGLWRNPARARLEGAAAREWVMQHHTWAAAADEAMRTVIQAC